MKLLSCARALHRLDPLGVAVALSALVISCASPGEPATDSSEQVPSLGPVPAGAFTTDATGYLAYRLPESLPRYQFRIVSRFENRGVATLYLGRCFPESPQPLFTVSDTAPVASGYGQNWACVGHAQQFAIRPGEVRIDTLFVQGPNAFQGGTNVPIGVTQGDFRLYFDVRLAPGDGAPAAPDSLKWSNVFRVRTSERQR